MLFNNAKLFFSVLTLLVAWLVCSPRVEAQLAKSAIKIEISDPLGKAVRPGYRTIRATVSFANPGVSASRDETFYLVHRSEVRRDVVSYRKFVLPQGKSSVTVELLAQRVNGENGYFHDTIHVETDGNLNYTSYSTNDFAMSRHDAYSNNYRDQDSGLYFLFVTPDKPIDNYHTRSFVIDRTRRNRLDPLFETSLVPAPIPISLNASGVGATMPPTLPSIVILQEFLQQTNHWDNNAGPTQTAPSISSTTKPTDVDNRAYFNSFEHYNACDLGLLPETWLGLMPVDFVFLSAADLESLETTKSFEQVRALQQWIAAGGRLVVTDCGPNWEKLKLLPALILGHTVPPDGQLPPIRWNKPDEKSLTEASIQMNRPDDSSTAMPNQYPFSSGTNPWFNRQVSTFFRQANFQVTIADSIDAIGQDTSAAYFEHVYGRVIATPGNCNQFDQAAWRRLLAVAVGNTRHRNVEEVVGTGHLNLAWMHDFKVPGVGEAPRVWFLILITGFAIAVGPIAYKILNRGQRLSFLLVVVPLVSLSATLALLGFAFLADGFAHRVQRFSFTRLDQPTGTAVTVTEQAVFPGSNPRDYRHAMHQAFFVAQRTATGLSTLENDGAEVRITAPEIRARIPHQTTTADVFQTEQRLQIAMQNVEGRVDVHVTNHFDNVIEIAVIRVDDEYYLVENLAPGDSTIGVPFRKEEWRDRIGTVARDTVSMTQGVVRPNRYRRAYQAYYFGDSEYTSWGICEAFASTGRELNDYLKTQEYFAVLNNLDLAHELKPYSKYHSQKHFIHGSW